ncbi:MAG TPA: hypothetical protein VGH42_08915 [Verrucomicrobiae bacterium]
MTTPFSWSKNPDGTYSVPDFSNYSTKLTGTIPFYIPNLKWARVEVSGATNAVEDTFYNPPSNPIDSTGCLDLPLAYATNSASSGGSYGLKITLFDNNTFQIFDGDGNQIPETPFVLEMAKDSNNAYITVNGGDSGRGYMLQSSSDMKNWTNGAVQFVSPLPEAAAVPPTFSWPLASANQMFFRTATTNTVPTD